MLRTHGWKRKYEPELVGYNSRLDELQAAVLRVKLRHVDAWNDARRTLAAQYGAELQALGIGTPSEATGCRHVYHQYMIRVPNREHVQERLSEEGIANALYYPAPLHLVQPCRHLVRPGDEFPVAEQASADTLAIPFYPELTSDERSFVVGAVARAVGVREVPA
jgi:dTDP-4-amino-4,6-dideoxygalactose transaminase